MRFGIDKKVISLLILIIIVLGSSFGIYFINHEKKALLVELDERANTLLNSLANSCEYPVLIGDLETISKIAKGVLEQKDIINCEIVDKNGKTLFKQGTDKIKLIQTYTAPILTERIKRGAEEELILGATDGEKETELIGKIYLTLSLSSLYNKLEQASKTIIFIVIIGIIFASICGFFLVRYFLGRPIKQLVLGTENIARGNLDYKVPIKTNDEIGLLADSFNKMAQDLQKGLVSRHYLEMQVEERTFELRKSLVKERKVMEGIINAIALTIEMRDPYTAGHQRRVANLACAIAKEMNLNEEKIEQIRIAGVLHDIGKIYIPAEILSKPSSLDKNEFNLMKMHPKVGYDILKNIDFEWPIAQIVIQHHERINGSGYPNGLIGDNILLEAKILGLADVVEAMASDRPYRPALSIEETIQHISQNKGTLYEPAVVEACLRLFMEKNFSFK